ncbi:hypothetical protein A6R68_18505 [Neotoma lepida]|uniref:Vacuolar protein sorting-associated protein 33A n=1 Tax=Neotoma lepida TaxID=56216 RepID=A0A1A6HMZ6_NEOLE|nr:hypothetical protein A6R68_18505 [Neotoma lepida]
MAAHLSYGRVNLNVLREAVRRELREFLDKCAGSKEHEVEKMFTLKGNRLPAADVKNIIFLVRPRLELMDIIAENVLSNWPLSPQECYLEGDQTSLYHAAKGLMTLQALYGTIPHIFGKGECARQVANMMVRMKREFTGSQNSVFPVFDNLLLLDRNVDLLTPLATQLTYEGLIDEIYGIQNSKLCPFYKQGGGGGKDLPTEAKKLQLNSAEELYAEIRDKNFNAVGSVLSKKAKIISAAFEERHNAKTVGEIKQFVSQLPHMQAARGSLANHTSIAELIKDVTTSEDFFDKLTVEQEFMSGIDTDKVNSYIEDCIAQKHSLIKVLRLVCLQSVCSSGLRQKVLDYYKREILQVNPTDISYVYSGYAPLSVRLAQLLSRPGWRSIEEVLRILPGPHFEERQPLPTGLQKKRQPGENRVTLIFFLGGVTFAEIAALRFLSQLEDGGTEYVIATTKLMNGSSWIEALMEKPR